MQRIHPAIAHFPLALLLVSVLFDAFGYALRRPSLHVVGLWNLLAGVVGGGAAAYSGYLAEQSLLGLELPAGLMGSHRQMAFLAVVLFAVLLACRLVLRRPAMVLSTRTAPVYLLVAIVAGIMLTSAGRSGNRLVFEAAAGVMTPERPRVAVLPGAGASSQVVWALGATRTPAYGRPSVSPAAARMRAALYLRGLRPGPAFLRVRNGCKELHVTLLHNNLPVLGLRMDPESGQLLARSEQRCAGNVRLPMNEIGPRILQSLREVQVGASAWQGGEGTYWNVPFFKRGRMIDIVRISARDGTIVPLTTVEATKE
ncbi:MAG: hypothetical protein Q8R92_02425 [Deltaproteobacteria bacterium]|nr:hypothetical protein [Deltaproteobacteria bacterium]